MKTAPETRKAIFIQIHEVVFYGKGGYSWYDVYNMPIWLRKFTHAQISDFYQKESDSIESSKSGGSNSKTLVSPDGKIQAPEFIVGNNSKKVPKYY